MSLVVTDKKEKKVTEWMSVGNVLWCIIQQFVLDGYALYFSKILVCERGHDGMAC